MKEFSIKLQDLNILLKDGIEIYINGQRKSVF